MQQAFNKQSRYGWSPLLVAAEKGHLDIVRLLLDHNARSDIFEEVNLKFYVLKIIKLSLLFLEWEISFAFS